MNSFHHKIVTSVSDIERSQWELLFGRIPESYGFYQTLETSHLEGFSFYYLLLYQDRDLILIAPLFTGDFDLGLAVEGIMKKIIQGIRKLFPRFMILKTLFCGSPFGENGVIGLSRNQSNRDSVMEELAKAMIIYCSLNQIPFIMFKDFLDAEMPLMKPLLQQNFFEVESFPSVRVELGPGGMEGYFQTLSRHARKDLRKKIKKVLSLGSIEVKVVDDVETIINDIYPLYLNTYNAGAVRFEKLTKEFFVNVGRYMSGQTKFFLYYVQGHLAAFNLCFQDQYILIDKFIGFDYELTRKYHLYFFSWYTNIEWCLKHSLRFYQVGQTDYKEKLRLGGYPLPLHVFVRHHNPMINRVLKSISKLLTPSQNNDDLKLHE